MQGSNDQKNMSLNLTMFYKVAIIFSWKRFKCKMTQLNVFEFDILYRDGGCQMRTLA